MKNITTLQLKRDIIHCKECEITCDPPAGTPRKICTCCGSVFGRRIMNSKMRRKRLLLLRAKRF